MGWFGAVLPEPDDYAAWRAEARRLLGADAAPEVVDWRVQDQAAGLFAAASAPSEPPALHISVPRAFPALAEQAIRHSDPERFALLYQVLWRLTHGEHELLADATDPDIVRLQAMAKAVRRDAHKLHAFLRFRPIVTEVGPRYLAWFEPGHHILRAEAMFFVRRFAQLHWSIMTPELSAHWDSETLDFGPGGNRQDVPCEDAGDALWRTYYVAICNPARLKPTAMRAEMPRKYWRNLPETREIPRIMAEAPARVAEMIARGGSVPASSRQRPPPISAPGIAAGMDDLASLRAEVLADCALPWATRATQAVFGEGPPSASLMLIGEQPGDKEDLVGRPFVGPAGQLLDRALAEVGIDRGAIYLTNAVKHFKYTPIGRRRLHQSPDAEDITHYRPFLRREIALVRPRLVVALGASALRALAGKALVVGKVRGLSLELPDTPPVLPTVHPSYLLRLPDATVKREEYGRFLADLREAARLAGLELPGESLYQEK